MLLEINELGTDFEVRKIYDRLVVRVPVIIVYYLNRKDSQSIGDSIMDDVLISIIGLYLDVTRS